jgi:hypothetical protein
MVYWAHQDGNISSPLPNNQIRRMVNQAKLNSYNTAKKLKIGYQVARNYAKAVRLDERNGNSK